MTRNNGFENEEKHINNTLKQKQNRRKTTTTDTILRTSSGQDGNVKEDFD